MTDTSRGTLVRMALDLLRDLTVRPPLLEVSWSDFPLWTAHLGADHVLCSLRSDGRVNVTAVEQVGNEWGSVQVTAIVDAVHGVEVPPSATAGSEWIPVTELDRCFLRPKAVA